MSPSLVCDSRNDCMDGSDEDACKIVYVFFCLYLLRQVTLRFSRVFISSCSKLLNDMTF